MKQLLKIDMMHKLFGTVDDKCKNCKHFVKLDTSGMMSRHSVQKCKIYGLTHSESSDWAQKWKACGLFNMDYPYSDRKQVIELEVNEEYEDVQLEGQIKI